MSSAASASEEDLARRAIAAATLGKRPRVLVGGLGLGCTLRAALDALPDDAEVVVAELSSQVVAWGRGPLAASTGDALADPRVAVEVGDVSGTLERAGRTQGARFDVVLLDLFTGPRGPGDPHFGRAGLERAARALTRGGRLAVWSEQPEPAFERALRASRLPWSRSRAGRGGRRHAIYLIEGGRTPRGR